MNVVGYGAYQYTVCTRDSLSSFPKEFLVCAICKELFDEVQENRGQYKKLAQNVCLGVHFQGGKFNFTVQVPV